MYVRNKMTANPYTIDEDAPITDAITLMQEKGVRRLPVVVGNKAVGIITKSDIQSVSPTKATTLSIYEINYLLSKSKVKDTMTKTLITISPDALLEEAAVLMRDNGVSGLVVVDDANNVIGIITESNIFDAFIEIFGFRNHGTRITVETVDKVGVMSDIAKIFSNHNASITNVVVLSGPGDKAEIVFRTSSLNTKSIEAEIIEKGYEIISVTEYSDE